MLYIHILIYLFVQFKTMMLRIEQCHLPTFMQEKSFSLNDQFIEKNDVRRTISKFLCVCEKLVHVYKDKISSTENQFEFLFLYENKFSMKWGKSIDDLLMLFLNDLFKWTHYLRTHKHIFTTRTCEPSERCCKFQW